MDQPDVQALKARLEKERTQILQAIGTASAEQRDKLVRDSIELTKLIEALNTGRLN